MTKQLLALFTLTAVIFISACGHEQNRTVLDMPEGKYEKNVSSTDSHGTTTEKQTSTEVEVDEYGNKKAVIETKTTKDPKGLFNKRTVSETKEVIEENR